MSNAFSWMLRSSLTPPICRYSGTSHSFNMLHKYHKITTKSNTIPDNEPDTHLPGFREREGRGKGGNE